MVVYELCRYEHYEEYSNKTNSLFFTSREAAEKFKEDNKIGNGGFFSQVLIKEHEVHDYE